MSTQEMAINGLPEFHGDLTVKSEEQASDMDHDGDGYLINGNAVSGFDGTHDQLVQMVIELNFQNLYLKSHIEGLKSIQLDSGGISVSGNVKELHEKIESLNRELLEHKQAQVAAEDALKHLRESYSEADAKAQQLSAKLSEVEQKMDQEIKERDDKYNELDSKFGRLHKRAKQRIQDVQKEKDDLEARLGDVNEMAERASSQQAFLQQELERSQKQANEALRVMDVERQQLRTANNKFRETIDELRRSLEAKENTLEGLQKSLLEKEQMLEDMRGLLQAADEKRQSSISELSVKHQKNLESLEAQLADVLADRSKADETISALRVSVAEKESKIAEMEAASTGEAVRLGAALETVKGELGQLKLEHEKDKESWEAANKALKTKLEMSESACIRSEIEAAKMRSQLELELSVQNQLLNSKDADLATAKEEICRLESEFSAYKVRAHALLQKKDAEIAAAKDSELLQAQEEALNKAEKEVALAAAERDTAIQELQDVLAKHDKELAARDAALSDAEQQIKSIQQKLDSVHTHYQAQREAWESNLQNLEESWRLKCQALENQANSTSREDLQNELEGLKLHYQKLKEEHDSFRDIADRMIEEKDKEISRLLNDNKILQRSIGSRPSVDHNGNHYSGAFQKQDTQVSNTSAAEQQILILARQQAQREEELAQSQRHILALQEEIEELERENRLHGQQEAMLKAELRNMERMQKREGVDMTYLKNVILKLLETGEVDALLPVIGMLLQFSPEEVQKCQQASRTRSSTDVPPSPASDASASGLSLFSRFSLS